MQAAKKGEADEPQRFIVVLKEQDATAAVARRHTLTREHVYSHAIRGFSARMSRAERQRLAADPSVAFIEADVKVHSCSQTIPTGVRRILATENTLARIDGVDGEGERVDVGVAIIDSGIDLDHPDLNVVGGRNFIKFSSPAEDDNGHGTHVAGIVGALDNDFGVVGVAPGARLWALKVLGEDGTGSMADVIAAVDYVTANADKISVANLSLGGEGQLATLRMAIQNSIAQGVVYVAAAGNDGMDIYGNDNTFGTSDDFIPAAYPEVMTVSAMVDTDGLSGGMGIATGSGLDDQIADFSNYSTSVIEANPVNSPGAAIDVAAPGVSIRSTKLAGSYGNMSGTSMAAPHVAGAAALYIARHGRATNAAGVAAIRQAIIDLGQMQSQWRPDGQTDLDSKREPLGHVGQPKVVAWQVISSHGGQSVVRNVGANFVLSHIEGLRQIRVEFNKTIDADTLLPAAVGLSGRESGNLDNLIATIEAEAGNRAALITLSSAPPDAQSCTLMIKDSLHAVDGAGFGGNLLTVDVACLVGDVTGNRLVTAADVQAVRQEAGREVDADNAACDVDGSGRITANDLRMVQRRNGNSAAVE